SQPLNPAEIARKHRGRGQRRAVRVHVLTDRLPFFADKEEELVLEDGAAQIATIIVEAQNLFLFPKIRDASSARRGRSAERRKVICGVECVVANELEQPAVKVICSAAGHDVDCTSRISSVLSGE